MAPSHRRFPANYLGGFLSLAILLGGILTLAAAPVHAVTPIEIDASVDKAVQFLLGKQQKDGSWEATAKQAGGAPQNDAWGGETALVTYAVSENRGIGSELGRAIKWLEHEDLHGTYAVAIRSQIWNRVSWREDKDKVTARDHDSDFLLYGRIRRGPDAGFYGKGFGSALPAGGFAAVDPKGPPDGSTCDRTDSQYAVLGMWALAQSGASVPIQYWKDVQAAWKKAQLADGGWDEGLGAKAGANWTMTCAGLAALLAIEDSLLRFDSHQFDTCAGGVTSDEIKKGLGWMDSHFRQILGGPEPVSLDCWNAIARVGVLSGRRYFGGVDWFRTGADAIVKTQRADGGWGSIDDTCLAILFLAQGRAPVMMQKLQYASATQIDPWNERPADLANLEKWMGPVGLCSCRLRWQLVTLDAPAADLHDASILFISGSQSLDLGDREIEKLRTFVEEGGMILGNADCARKPFVASFVKLGKKMFHQYDFRKLPARHPIFDECYQSRKWKTHSELLALSNGVRELMVISPDSDMARAWQAESAETSPESFQLACNIYLYATGKEELDRRENFIAHPDGPAGRELKIARIEAGGNWDPEPGAWKRLSVIMHNQQHIDIKAEPVKLGQGKLADYKIAAFTGTTEFAFNDAERKEIKDFVDGGGTLIIDAAGGAAAFGVEAAAELKLIFRNAEADLEQPLPISHPFYAGAKIESVNYRRFERRQFAGSVHDPRLRGITVNGDRIGVFFSREDITAGLVGEQIDGIIGYDPAVATRLMVNMILYADQKH